MINIKVPELVFISMHRVSHFIGNIDCMSYQDSVSLREKLLPLFDGDLDAYNCFISDIARIHDFTDTKLNKLIDRTKYIQQHINKEVSHDA